MKKGRLVVGILMAITFLSGCQQTDVIGKVAQTSFKEVLDTSPDQVTADDVNGGWSLEAPDKTARFIWSKDYSSSPIHDVMLEVDAKPFVDAGLDISKLPSGIAFDDKLMVGTKLGSDKLTYDGEATPYASFQQIVKLYRSSIGYHEKLDHYGVDVGNGNKFEWAKDMATNDKDIVFVLDPQMLLDAGVNPDQVEGWNYASVEVKDNSGKTVEVMKFLKPFNLK